MDIKNFLWTYDQLQRYRVLEACLQIFFAEKNPSVLDVGGVSPQIDGQGCWFPVQFIKGGRSIVLDKQRAKGPDFIQGDGASLPFLDSSLDVVCSLDVLEHVPKNKRPDFLAELCRVASKMVILSAPFASDDIEKAEATLAQQIERLYGTKHHQLQEHSQLGLPEIEEVVELLQAKMTGVTFFFYGSLKNWLILQALRHTFLGRRSSRLILNILDQWMTELNPDTEWRPPFYRCFWLGSKEIERKELEKKIEVLKEKLGTIPSETDFLDLELAKKFSQAVVEYFRGDKISAIVVAQRGGPKLRTCLEHLLSQRINLDFEVLVCFWPDQAKKKFEIEKQFPGVKTFLAKKDEKTSSALLRITDSLIGNYILLLTEDILLTGDSVQKLYNELKAYPEIDVIVPRIQYKKFFTPVWTGSLAWLKKILAGRLLRLSKITKSEMKSRCSSWIYSECLFFRKKALFSRLWKRRRISNRSIFLWETDSPSFVLYSPGIIVYKS
jgi:hypothetical protein